MKEWKEWIVEECPAFTLDGKILSTMLRREQELVRCKDCKWFLPDDTCGNKRLSDQEDIATLGPDWFCADGEQK